MCISSDGMGRTVYLDYAATTPVCPAAARAALEALTDGYGNPSSTHPVGQAAAARLRRDRESVAAALGCAPEDLFFTSGGTEGDNWAVRAAVRLGARRGRHIITSAVEHSAVLEPLKALEQEGYSVTRLKPDQTGRISVDELRAALREDTVLVTLMLVNNEVGSIQPVAEAVRAVKAFHPQILFHTDAVQGFCKIPFTPAELGVDFLTVSGHKIGAPKGIGAQYIRRTLHRALPPLLRGGGQESGLRSGTEPTAQIAAFAAACRDWQANRDAYAAALREIKAYALDALARVPSLEWIAPGGAPHICAVSLPGFPGEMVVRELGERGICISSGSACHRGRSSHVFAALSLPKRTRTGALRLSFSPATTKAEIDALCRALTEITRQRVAMR